MEHELFEVECGKTTVFHVCYFVRELDLGYGDNGIGG